MMERVERRMRKRWVLAALLAVVLLLGNLDDPAIPAEAGAEIAPLAQYNIDKVWEIAGRILEVCRQPLCFEAILQRLFAAYGLSMDFQQYVLVGSTVRSYLAWLKDTGKLTARCEDNLLLWERV